nr:isoamylase, starch debranching enzyme/1,4-alpha-glucan branching enzyme Ii (ISAII) [Polytomella parva]
MTEKELAAAMYQDMLLELQQTYHVAIPESVEDDEEEEAADQGLMKGEGKESESGSGRREEGTNVLGSFNDTVDCDGLSHPLINGSKGSVNKTSSLLDPSSSSSSSSSSLLSSSALSSLPPSSSVSSAAPVPPPTAPGSLCAPHSGYAILNSDGLMSNGAGAPTGHPMSDPPLIEVLSEHPLLRDVKLIAEAWDCDGLNQVGAFPHFGGRWSEWNGHFRDAVRRFIKGTEGPWAGPFASALCGSPNVFAESSADASNWWANHGGRQWRGGRGPAASVNFVTAHDGFSLGDLVRYNEKHNEANGEENRDGESHNLSWNCGAEGETADWSVNRLRQRQIRNTATALLLASGVPMLTMGDEYGHSKYGNNNTYCHDDPVNYFRWDLAHQDTHGFGRFMRLLINFRRRHPGLLQRSAYMTSREVSWHGDEPGRADWSDASRLVAFTLHDTQVAGAPAALFAAFNTSHLPKTLALPRQPGRVWRQIIDTGKVAPYDFLVEDEAEARRMAAITSGAGQASDVEGRDREGQDGEGKLKRKSRKRRGEGEVGKDLMSHVEERLTKNTIAKATRPLCLDGEEVKAAHAANSMWLADHNYPMVSWSCILLESVPEDPSITLAACKRGDGKALRR